MNEEKVIVGNTVGPPLPRSDLRETDPKKGSYVLGREMLGDLNSLDTENKNSLVDAINEVAGKGNGTPGQNGADGKDGYTPVKGVDYYTPADKAEFEAFIAAELAKRGQIQPEFANSVEECTDTTKLYVLPDGFYYAYMAGFSSRRFTAADFVYSEVNSDGSLTGAGYTRIPTAELVDLSAGAVSISCPEPYQYFVYYYSGNDESTYIGKTAWKSGNTDDVLTDKIASGTISGAKYCRISLRDGTNTTALLRDRMDEFMENIIVSQMSDAPAYEWRSTGHAFNQPADYEDRIIALERALEGVLYGSF